MGRPILPGLQSRMGADEDDRAIRPLLQRLAGLVPDGVEAGRNVAERRQEGPVRRAGPAVAPEGGETGKDRRHRVFAYPPRRQKP